MLSGDEYPASEAAARALVTVGAEPELAAPELAHFLDAHHANPSWEVIEALREYGLDARCAPDPAAGVRTGGRQ
jgi:hypothetical protein